MTVREKLIKMIEDAQAGNPIVQSGDIADYLIKNAMVLMPDCDKDGNILPMPEIKTYRDAFLFIFPNARKYDREYPVMCMRSIFGNNADGPWCSYGGEGCKKCWDYPLIKDENSKS